MPYIIRSSTGNILAKDNGQWLVFDYPAQAMQYIEREKGNSPYLNPKKLLTSDK